MVLRDSTGVVFGALCVNLDVTAVHRAHALLGHLAGLGTDPARTPVTTFGNDIDSVVDAILDTHQLHRHHNWAGLDREDRLELFRRLGISRASAYSYLSQARAQADPTSQGGHP
jgi:predicted transcriptional regulator YheO